MAPSTVLILAAFSNHFSKINLPLSRKRKYRDENRVFNRQWTMQFLFVEGNGKPLCLVCQETMAVLKEYNLKSHYQSRHEVKYNIIRSQEREDKVKQLLK